MQRVTVLRDGKLVGTRKIAEVTQRELVQMMVGRELEAGKSGECPRRRRKTACADGRRADAERGI